MKLYPSILFVLVIAISGISIFGWSSWQDKQRAINAQLWVTHTHNAINHLDEIWILVNRNESAMRGYATTCKEAFVAEYDSNFANIRAHAAALRTLLADSPVQTARLVSIDSNLTRKVGFEHNIRMLVKTNPDSARLLIAGMKGKNIMDEIAVDLNAMKFEEEKLLHNRTLQTHHTAATQFKTIVISSGVAFIFILLILLRLNRDVNLRRKAQSLMFESEKRYREFVENAGMVSFTSDSNGVFTFISNQVEALTGYTVAELLGKHFTTLIDPKHVPEVIDHYAKQRGSMMHETTLKFPIVHKNGETRWVEQDTILLSKNGVLTGYQSVVKDITEKTLMNNRLLEMEWEKKVYQARIQAVLDNTPLAIYVKDMEGRYMLVNKQFRESFNVTDEEIIGKTIHDMGHKGEIHRHIEADKEVAESGKPVEIEDILRFADGEHHVLTIKFPLFDHNNKIFGISGFMKDISEMVRNREELISARQRAESAEMLQEQFLANMSHEIRTPMNGIVGMASLLQKTDLQQQQQEYVQIIRQSSDNLLVLINDILDLSKIKAGKISIEKIPFHLESSLAALTAGFKIKAEEKNIRFSCLMHPAVPVALKGDPHRLNQILANLLSNAMKFTSEGYVTLEVGVKEMNDTEVTLSFQVNDTGIGIEEKNINYIFDSFTQASSSTTRKFGGTGLGLAITKRLIEMQGGQIHISSRHGKGSTFTVHIPFESSSLHEVNQSIMPDVKPVIEGMEFAGNRVLIVEDNEINRIVLQSNLKQYDLEVAMATNGFEAVTYLQKNRNIDLVLMDIHMPEMDGFEATEAIRQQLKLDVPIVVLSASALKNEKQRSLELGANDYLTKPFKPEDLQACLVKYLGGTARAREEKDAVPQQDGMQTTYDLSNLMLMEDADTIMKLTEMFEAIVPESLADLKSYTIKKDWDKVRTISHSLKSSLSVIQISSIMKNMHVVEASAKERENLEGILPLVDSSITDYKVTLPLIKSAIAKEIASNVNSKN